MTVDSSLTPLSEQVALRIAHRYQLPERMERALRMIEHGPTRKLLRSHLDRTVSGKEIKERDNLDELLAGISILHIGGLDTPQVLQSIGINADEVLDLLEHPDVARYFESYYPYAPPVLARAAYRDVGASEYVRRLAIERHGKSWTAVFDRFLLLDASFNAPGPLEDFLAILDDYTIRDFDISDLEKAFRSEKQMARFLGHRMGRWLAEGLQDFLEFSDDLDSFLASCEDAPIFRGLVWLNYGYWYGAGGERIRQVSRWMIETLNKLVEEPTIDDRSGLERSNQLNGTMERLVALEHYPREILQTCHCQLDRWLHHVAAQRKGSDPH